MKKNEMKKNEMKKNTMKKLQALCLAVMLGAASAMPATAAVVTERDVNAAASSAAAVKDASAAAVTAQAAKAAKTSKKAGTDAAKMTTKSSSSAKSEAQKVLKQFFKYAKSGDKDSMEECVKDNTTLEDDYYFSDSGTAKVYAVVKEQNKKRFSYSIVDTSLAKDKASATIKVKVNYRSLCNASWKGTGDFLTAWESYYAKHDEDPSDEKLGSMYASAFKSAVKKNPAKNASKTVSVKVRKYGKTWKLESVSVNLLNVCFCEVDKGFYKALETANEQ